MIGAVSAEKKKNRPSIYDCGALHSSLPDTTVSLVFFWRTKKQENTNESSVSENYL